MRHRLRRLCRWLIRLFVAAWAAALALFAIGTFGLLGQPADPLGAVFLLPLGLPWNILLDGTPDTIRPWLAAAAPAVNLAILVLLCRRCHERAEPVPLKTRENQRV